MAKHPRNPEPRDEEPEPPRPLIVPPAPPDQPMEQPRAAPTHANPHPAPMAAPAPRTNGVGVMPLASTPWPIPGDVPDLETIIADQSATISAQAALIDAYQGWLDSLQNPQPGTPASGTGTTAGSSTSLAINAVTGVIIVGSTVTSTGIVTIPTGTIVLGQISGSPGGVGSYLLNNAVNIATAQALSFTPPPPATTWPSPTDAPTLMLVQQMQASVLRIQSALLQAYQDLLNTSQTPAPPTGP